MQGKELGIDMVIVSGKLGKCATIIRAAGCLLERYRKRFSLSHGELVCQGNVLVSVQTVPGLAVLSIVRVLCICNAVISICCQMEPLCTLYVNISLGYCLKQI